jgi:hypothetical protein
MMFEEKASANMTVEQCEELATAIAEEAAPAIAWTEKTSAVEAGAELSGPCNNEGLDCVQVELIASGSVCGAIKSPDDVFA